MSPFYDRGTPGGRVRGARRPFAALSGLCLAGLIATGALAPAYGEELVPETPDATSASPAPTSGPGSEPAPPEDHNAEESAPEEPAPEEPAPEEPAPEEPGAPTPGPTDPPQTPTPTPTPTAPPVTSAPQPPKPTTAPAPRPVPAPRITRVDDTQRAASIAAARLRLGDALAELDAARRFYEGALATARQAQAIVEVLSARLSDARSAADRASLAYLTAVRGASALADLSDLDVMLRTGDDLLGGLGTVERLTALASDPESLAERAHALQIDADELQARSDTAHATLAAVPVAQAKADVARAEQQVAAARSALARLSAPASSGVVELVNLPTDSGELSELGWSAPVFGRLTDGFGPRPHKPLPYVNDFHRGTDIGAPCDAPIFAATDGVVVEAGRAGTYGNWLLIDHGAGVTTGYAHIADGGTFVGAGERVAAGQTIAAVGDTGASTGCHLHFEVRLGGVAIDAIPFLAARGVDLG